MQLIHHYHLLNSTKIIKELFKVINDDFKQTYPKHNDIIGFESWFIDTKGNIYGTTRNIYLFIYIYVMKRKSQVGC